MTKQVENIPTQKEIKEIKKMLRDAEGHLNLSGMRLSNVAIPWLANAIKNANVKLTSLNLSRNWFAGNWQDVQQLAHAIQAHPNLTQVDLSENMGEVQRTRSEKRYRTTEEWVYGKTKEDYISGHRYLCKVSSPYTHTIYFQKTEHLDQNVIQSIAGDLEAKQGTIRNFSEANTATLRVPEINEKYMQIAFNLVDSDSFENLNLVRITGARVTPENHELLLNAWSTQPHAHVNFFNSHGVEIEIDGLPDKDLLEKLSQLNHVKRRPIIDKNNKTVTSIKINGKDYTNDPDIALRNRLLNTKTGSKAPFLNKTYSPVQIREKHHAVDQHQSALDPSEILHIQELFYDACIENKDYHYAQQIARDAVHHFKDIPSSFRHKIISGCGKNERMPAEIAILSRVQADDLYNDYVKNLLFKQYQKIILNNLDDLFLYYKKRVRGLTLFRSENLKQHGKLKEKINEATSLENLQGVLSEYVQHVATFKSSKANPFLVNLIKYMTEEATHMQGNIDTAPCFAKQPTDYEYYPLEQPSHPEHTLYPPSAPPVSFTTSAMTYVPSTMGQQLYLPLRPAIQTPIPSAPPMDESFTEASSAQDALASQARLYLFFSPAAQERPTETTTPAPATKSAARQSAADPTFSSIFPKVPSRPVITEPSPKDEEKKEEKVARGKPPQPS